MNENGWRFAVLLLVVLVAGAVSADITSGLVGHWPLDGDTLDASGRGNDGVLNGNAALAPDRFGTPDMALFCPGEADAYVFIGDLPDFQITGALTLTAWVVLDSANANNGRIVAKAGGSGSRSWNLNIEATSGGVNNPAAFQISATGATTLGLLDTQSLPTDQWVHLAGVYRPGAAMELYVDGQLHASSTSGIPDSMFSANGLPVLIGSRNACGNCGWDGFIDDVRIYTRALSHAEIRAVMQGNVNLSSNPEPPNEATDVPRDVVLSWASGAAAATHDVYLGTTAGDVNDASRADGMDVLASQGQTAESFDPPGLLEFGQTYYWRVDEVNAAPDNTIFKGDVWSFTAEPLAYPVTNITATASASQANSGPQRTVDGSGLDEEDLHSIAATDMWLAAGGGDPVWIQYEFDRVYKLHELWVWNYNVQFEMVLGFGVKDVTIEYSRDGENWTAFGDVEFAQATAMEGYAHNTTVDLDGVIAKYVRLNVNSGWGIAGQFGLSEVRFLYVPVQAREPQPADGAASVDPESVLSWRAGRDVASHDVYLGTDAETLELAGSVEAATYTPTDLLFGHDYYWRVDEVNEADATAVWPGELWSFATQDFVLVEGFEDYNDDDNRIYDTWLDGWVNETGSTVGYLEEPFAETSIVHGGRQSMPLTYDNSAAPFYSEAEYDVGGMDWDVHGADTLRLFVYGQAPAFVESADGSISMSAIGTDIWNAGDECRYVYKQLTGDGSMTVRVDYLDGTPSTWAKGGVMVRQTTEAGAINAFLAMTGGDGGGATFQQRLTADDVSVSQHTYEGNPFAPPYWVRLERAGSALTASISPDGETWQQAGDTATVTMSDPVLIGLALTSHNAAVGTSAAFSNISTTGNVTGSWQMAEIGVAQPAGGNAAETLYVAIEDSSGHVAIATHPDAAVRSGWTEWLIPFSDFAGVNLSSVRTLYIGLGDRNNPSAGGAGLIFIDDIAYGSPAVLE